VDLLLTSKLYIPPTRPELVPWRRLAEQSNETLKRANLFIIPLDHERQWYRYALGLPLISVVWVAPDTPANAGK
jgi:hypothetical protein